MSNNKGFSLIELIVVMAIMGILLGMGVQIFGLTENGYVKRGSEDISDMMKKAVVNAQSVAAKEWTVTIKPDGSSYVAVLNKVTQDASGNQISEEIESRKLSGKVEVSFSSAFRTAKVSESAELTIAFDKESGEVKTVTVGANTYTGADLQLGTGEKKGSITVTSKNHKKSIEIYWSTGKIFMS